MLTIVPVDEQRRRALAAVFSAPEVQGMAALSGEREEGWGAFLFNNDTLTLLHLEADSPAVKDGLLRAILNVGRRAGILRACCKQRELADFLTTEGFEDDKGILETELNAFFGRPCRGNSL